MKGYLHGAAIGLVCGALSLGIWLLLPTQSEQPEMEGKITMFATWDSTRSVPDLEWAQSVGSAYTCEELQVLDPPPTRCWEDEEQP